MKAAKNCILKVFSSPPETKDVNFGPKLPQIAPMAAKYQSQESEYQKSGSQKSRSQLSKFQISVYQMSGSQKSGSQESEYQKFRSQNEIFQRWSKMSTHGECHQLQDC